MCLHPVVFAGLNTHVPSPQMLHATSTDLDSNRVLEDHQRFITLTHDPLVWLLRSSGIGSDEETGPESVRVGEMRKLGRGRIQDLVKPVERSLQIQVLREQRSR